MNIQSSPICNSQEVETNYPSMNKQNMVYYSLKHYLENEILRNAVAWMNFENMLKEARHKRLHTV